MFIYSFNVSDCPQTTSPLPMMTGWRKGERRKGGGVGTGEGCLETVWINKLEDVLNKNNISESTHIV